ncbi:L,D-transpeptidase family protein, partial [Listeria booriae]|uniref:L,D-transpeptidase family protein n=2 Tax=Listeria TaxID=1637 RepID=UPI0035D54659
MRLASRTNQIITVVASGSSAQVKFWEKSGSTWKQVFATSGRVGSQGVGSADEYHSRTPRGAYSLGFAFGTSNPGTSLSFRQITNKSYWISNVNDSQYNTWQERNSSNKADERMASYPTQYRYGVVINYNTARTKGAGSGFFLHCSNGAATAGCVAIPTSNMATVLQKLHSGAYIVNV